MAIELLHVGEALVEKMALADLDKFYDACGLTRAPGVDWEVCREMKLQRWGDHEFDGMAKVDLVARTAERKVTPIEIKMGITRLSANRVEHLLKSGKLSKHKPRRWCGNMMAILDRRYPPDGAQPEKLKVNDGKCDLDLTEQWILIARRKVLKSWEENGEPEFIQKVKRVSVETIAENLGAAKFDKIVKKLIGAKHYDRWITAH